MTGVTGLHNILGYIYLRGDLGYIYILAHIYWVTGVMRERERERERHLTHESLLWPQRTEPMLIVVWIVVVVVVVVVDDVVDGRGGDVRCVRDPAEPRRVLFLEVRHRVQYQMRIVAARRE